MPKCRAGAYTLSAQIPYCVRKKYRKCLKPSAVSIYRQWHRVGCARHGARSSAWVCTSVSAPVSSSSASSVPCGRIPSVSCSIAPPRRDHGAVTPFQAVCTALGQPSAPAISPVWQAPIAIGGPGAVFWMWISALLGMVTKYSEVTLAVHYRQKNKHGDWVGGPMYYIQNGLGKKWKF